MKPGGYAAAGPGPEAPLLPRSGVGFEYTNRPRRDVEWLIAYAVLLVVSLGGGFFSFLHRNTRYGELLGPDSLADPKLCPLNTTRAARRLLQQGPDAPSALDLDDFMRSAGLWIGASAGGAILVGLMFAWLVQRAPRGMVLMALALQVSVPAAVGCIALAQGMVVPAVAMLAFAGLTLLLFALWKPQIDLVTALLGVAGRGLSSNPGLVPLSLGLQLLVGLLEVPLVMASIAAFMNGQLVYNGVRVDAGAAAQPEQCVDADGQQVLCCSWQTDPWVPGFLAVAGVSMLWTLFLAFQVKLFTVSGAIAQWYFAPRTSSSLAAAGPHAGRSPTLTALRLAVGPSLGSLCCGSAILTLVSLLRQAIEKARQQRGRNLIAACAAACLSVLLSLVEYVTRFATVRAAITGEAFLHAGRNVVALLTRNFMDAFGVWWLPPMILQSCTFVLAAAWAIVVWMASYATTWHGRPQGEGSAGLLAGISFLAAWAVLGFLASLLLNIIDAVFVCFAMDREAGQVSHEEVHAVYAKLPTVGPVVEQPDGGLAYGAPELQGAVTRV